MRPTNTPEHESATPDTTPQVFPVSSNEKKTKKIKESGKNLNRLGGWLALFIVGLIISFLVTVFGILSTGFLLESEITSLNDYQAGLGDSLRTLTTFEDISVFIAALLIIVTLVLLFRKKAVAKKFAIGLLAFMALYGIVDFIAASALFDSSDIFQTPDIDKIMSDYGSDVARSVLSACVWIPYFLTSKRVKATLVK